MSFEALIPEIWTLWSVGVVVTVLRLYARGRRLGFLNYQADDGLVFFGLLWFTVLVVMFDRIAAGVGSNLMTEEEVEQLTPESKDERVRGSKYVFISEHAMLLTIWSMKAAMLVLFARLTHGSNTRQQKLIKVAALWVFLAFVGDELALFLICRPLTHYWAVPVDDPQCATYEYYQIINAVFNISTDIFIIGIGLTPVLKAKMSIQQKVVLTVIFGMGFFVIVAAIIRAIYCLVPSLISYVYMNWYFREASVAIYVTNLPPIWVLLRETFPYLQKLGSRGGSGEAASRGEKTAQSWAAVKHDNDDGKRDQDLLHDSDTKEKALVSHSTV